MKKIYLILAMTIGAITANAQVEFGFQFSPTLSTTRLESNTEAFDFEKYKSGIRFNAGPVFDIFLRDNIAISTGLWYSVKRTGISSLDTTAGSTAQNSVTNTQYLNLPIGFKFYTQEFIPNTRLFLNFGAIGDIKISKDKISLNGKDLKNPGTFSKIGNASLNVGIGADIKVGNNKAFTQLYYNRGLINMLTKNFSPSINNKNLSVNSDQIGLMFGYKF
jgi:hypothetical protein